MSTGVSLATTPCAPTGKDLPVHGDGGSVRSYLFVDDVADAFDCVLHKGKLGELPLLFRLLSSDTLSPQPPLAPAQAGESCR